MIRSATNVMTTARKNVDAMREPEVGGEVDRLVRVGEGDGLVGDLGEQAVERA